MTKTIQMLVLGHAIWIDILQVALLKVVFFGRFPASDKGGMNLSNGLPSNWKTLSWKWKAFPNYRDKHD